MAAGLQAAMPGHVVRAEPWEGAAVWDGAGRFGVQAFEEVGPGVLPALLPPATDPATRPDPGQERPGAPGR